MSESSPEERPFIPKPSPLLTKNYTGQTKDQRRIRRMDPNASAQEIQVVLPTQQAPAWSDTSSGHAGFRDAGTAVRRHHGPVQRQATHRSDSGSRRRPPTREQSTKRHSQRSDRTSTVKTDHKTSFEGSGFRDAGIEDLIDTTDLKATFDPGGFSSPEYAGRSKNIRTLLDRSPTPPYERDPETIGQIHRSLSRSRSRRRQTGDYGGDRSVSKKSVEDAIEDELGIVPIDANQAIAKTFIRPQPPTELLDYPVIFNPRVSLHMSITQPLYTGGTAVDGRLQIHIRGTRLDDIRLGRVSVDIAGVEELSFTRKAMFMSVATELIDEDHPPPAAMLMPADHEEKTFWKVKPSRSFLPFRLNLPLNVGPGCFDSVRARIRYVIHGTIMISINGSKSIVRCSRDIRMIPALDPETALLPLETPLLSTEEHALRWGGHKTLKVTAGLHRAVWVAGTCAYVDVNIINKTNRRVRSIKCKLRRHILAYKNTVALTENKSAGHLRVPNWIERKTLSHSELNIGSRWKGVKGSQLDVVTCEVDIPRNQLSVKMGRYFEVKYLVDVAVCTLAARTVRVQLPVTIIHMNSLDVIPNDLPEVTAAITKKYGRVTTKSYLPGRAFVAPREHIAEVKGLQKPLIPDRVPLQPRKASLRRIDTKKRGRGSQRRAKPSDDLREFDPSGFGGGGSGKLDNNLTDDRKNEYDENRAASRSNGNRRSRSRKGPVPNKSTKDLLKELQALKGQ